MKKLRRILALLLLTVMLCGCMGVTQEDAIDLGLQVAEALLTDTETTPPAAAPETQPQQPQAPPETEDAPETEAEAAVLPEDGEYTSLEEVSLYLSLYGHLPQNFITKKEAQSLGWPGGDLTPYAPGKSIGGDRFGNYEGVLPEGRNYRECDIDYHGGKRSAKRIVFSDDGLIYYTEDHYETFTILYGEE